MQMLHHLITEELQLYFLIHDLRHLFKKYKYQCPCSIYEFLCALRDADGAGSLVPARMSRAIEQFLRAELGPFYRLIDSIICLIELISRHGPFQLQFIKPHTNKKTLRIEYKHNNQIMLSIPYSLRLSSSIHSILQNTEWFNHIQFICALRIYNRGIDVQALKKEYFMYGSEKWDAAPFFVENPDICRIFWDITNNALRFVRIRPSEFQLLSEI